MNLYTATITLFLVMDPLGNIPMFISSLRDVDPKKRTFIIFREACFAFIILTAFLFGGKYLLKGMHASPAALSIAGGLILFIIAIRLIFPQAKGEQGTEHIAEPFIVPLAVPLFAGPATMATVMLLANAQGAHMGLTFLALVISWIAASIILLASAPLSRMLGKRGLLAIEKLMGILLTTVAVQMFLTGIQQYYHLVH